MNAAFKYLVTAAILGPIRADDVDHVDYWG